MELVMYIVINKDLGMSIGKTAAQACHACTEYLMHTLQNGTEEEVAILNQWHKNAQKKIILRANEKTMHKLESNENHFPIYDLGLTEIAPNSLTAICLGIYDKSSIPSNIKRLQVL